MPQDKQNHTLQAIKAYGKSLLAFIRKRVKTEADAEDILQDVWYSLSSAVNAEPIEQVGAWLYTVARNKITDKYKKKSETLIDDLFYEDDADEGDLAEFQSILLTEDDTPETEYLRNLFWDELFLALDELPGKQKQVFVWHELEDMSFQEIAEITGENIQTLVSRKRYAVLHLRKRLKLLYEDLLQN
jgi:RNA polymerase sigma factor (sigma-70 family)